MPKLVGRRRVFSIAFASLTIAAFATYLGVRLTQRPSALLDTGDKLASIAGLLVSIAALLSSWRSSRRPPVFEEKRLLADAEVELSLNVARQWEVEAAIRGLAEPTPLRTRWASTEKIVAARPAEILGSDWSAGRATRLKLHGTINDVASTLRQLPARQLVLIGPPGAGKTSAALIMTLDMLHTAKSGDPIPVLLTMTTWNPHEQSLESWLGATITRQYPVATDAVRFGPDVATRLLRAGRILPVLDGLDEMPSCSRIRAITALNNYLTKPRPILLTCRSEEYERAIEQAGSPLARAAVVELAGISGAEAADYLPAGQGVAGVHRWAGVVRHLGIYPDGVLAKVFSTPLMVYLARTAYRATGSDPAHLLTFTSSKRLEEHLLAAYVAAVYAPPTAGETRIRFRAEESQRWLAFLARHMTEAATKEIAWWRLIDAVPRRRALEVMSSMTLVAALTFTVAAIPGTLLAASVIAVVVALLLGIPLGLVTSLAEGAPRRVRVRPGKVLKGFAIGVGMALPLFPIMLVPGLLTGSMELEFIRMAVIAQVVFCLILGFLAGVVALLAEGISGPDPQGNLTDAGTQLRRDRHTLIWGTTTAALTTCLVAELGCFVVWLVLAEQPFPMEATLDVNLSISVLLAPIVSTACGAGAAWRRLQQARILLASQRHLPWRIIEFLDDAYRRGVLRKIGTEYQFRHARLQEFFANHCQI